MVFGKMLRAFGVGGPSVNTELANPQCQPGGVLQGQVFVEGGDHATEIEHVALALETKVEVETDDAEYDSRVEFHKVPITGPFHLPPKQRHAIPFQFPVPWETPVTTVFGQHLHGMTMGLRTELSVARAIDKGDLDPVAVAPVQSQLVILDAFARLGFRFHSADLERGRIRGVNQTLPFYQEIEFHAAPQYAHALNQVEVTFVTDPHGVSVVVEVDKRGGLFTSGRDVFLNFRVGHAEAGQQDLAAQIDGWLRQNVLR